MFNFNKKLTKILTTVLALYLVFPNFSKSVLSAPGDLDPSFGVNGKVINYLNTQFGSIHNAIVVQPDGKFITAGYIASNASIIRYNQNGTIDSSFGNNGIVTTNYGGLSASANDVTLQPDGKIILAGQTSFLDSRRIDFALARFNINGSLDTSFGNNGYTTVDFAGDTYSPNDSIKSIKILPDGKLIVAGNAGFTQSQRIGLVKYNADGSIDQSFGNNGKINTLVGSSVGVGSLIIQNDGKLIVAGGSYAYQSGTDNDFTVVRFNSDGSLDQSFGFNGKVVTDFFNGGDDATDLIIQDDNKIVVTGVAQLSNNEINFALIRYNASGSIDTNFGTNGKVTTSFNTIGSNATALIIQPDGKLVAAGDVEISGSGDRHFAIARYEQSGDLDLTFGSNGKVTTNLSDHPTQNLAKDILIDINKKFIVVGSNSETSGANRGSAMARYLTDNQNPISNAGVDQDSNEGQIVSFDGSQSTDPDGINDIVNYSWIFGDSTVGTGLTTNHIYSNNGTYNATLTVTDTMNQSSSNTIIITVNNTAPVINSLNTPSTIGLNTSFTANANFSDEGTLDTHTAIWNWGDGTSTGTITEGNGVGSVDNTHVYSVKGVYPVSITITDDDGASSTIGNTVTVVQQITSLSPASFWIGLKNSDSVGLHFDLLAEVYKNGTELISSGQLDGVSGGSSGFNNANLQSINLPLSNPVDFPTGSTLSLKLSVRNACTGPSHNSGFARLWYNDALANSHFGATIGTNNSNYYLASNFLLTNSIGTGPRKTIDIQSGTRCSAFKTFGTWNITP